MPVQTFAGPENPDSPIVTIRWTGAHHEIEILCDGALLTKIPGPEALRTTGLRGPTPAGDEVVVRLVNTGISEEFQVRRNGIPLLGSFVTLTEAGPGATSRPTHNAWATPVDTSWSASKSAQSPLRSDPDQCQKSARTWLQVLGALSILGGTLIFLLPSLSKTSTIDSGQAQLVGGLVFGIGALYVAVAALAHDARAKTMFTVGAVLTGLVVVSNVAMLAKGGGSGGGIISLILPALACRRCINARKVS